MPNNKKFKNFEEAKEYVSSLNIKKFRDWNKFSKSGKRPDNIPSNPNIIYKDEWKGWGDFLETQKIANSDKIFLSFNEAKKIINRLKLKNQKEWYEYCKSGNKPDNIPSAPYKIYKNEWIGYGDFLGTNTVATFNKEYLPFEEARVHAQSLELKSQKEWFDYCKSGNKPNNIPSHPDRTYKDEWISWTNWLRL